MADVLAVHRWPDNAALIRDAARLGYLPEPVLDPTYGFGNFWTRYRPRLLTASDLHYQHREGVRADDFLSLPWGTGTFASAVFDPPYKLEGTRSDSGNDRYGVPAEYVPPGKVMADLTAGAVEVARVVADGGFLLVKCQDQVCNGIQYWQTDAVRDALRDVAEKVDRFDFIGSAREQPLFPARRAGFIGPPKPRRQVHARGRGSTLLVFQINRPDEAG